jgi:hypothetical protein
VSVLASLSRPRARLFQGLQSQALYCAEYRRPWTTRISKRVDANGNEITKKDTYREGVAGTSQNHTTTMTDPDGATTTTRSKSTTKQE